MSAQACTIDPNAYPNIVGPWPWGPTIAPPYRYQQPPLTPWPQQARKFRTLEPKKRLRRRLRYSR
jgi:hypothetical protein